MANHIKPHYVQKSFCHRKADPQQTRNFWRVIYNILNIAYLKNSKLRQAFGKKNLSSCLNHSLLIAVSCVKKKG